MTPPTSPGAGSEASVADNACGGVTRRPKVGDHIVSADEYEALLLCRAAVEAFEAWRVHNPTMDGRLYKMVLNEMANDKHYKAVAALAALKKEGTP